MRAFCFEERGSLGKETLPLNKLKAADDEHFALENESVEKGTFPQNESKTADEGLFALERERALKKGAFRE